MEWVDCNICREDNTKLIFTKDGYNLVQCQKCSLVYVNPRKSPEELTDLYTFKNYFRTAFEFDNKSKAKNNLDKLSLIEKFSGKKGNILDVGCSTGIFLKAAQNLGWECYGVEISKDAVNYARQTHNLKGVVVGQLENINTFQKNFFDVITFMDSLEHMPDPLSALQKGKSLLKKGGLICISTPNISGLEPIITYYLFGKLFGNWRHPDPPHHIYQFSQKSIKKLLKNAGFIDVIILSKEIPLKYETGLEFSEIFKYLKNEPSVKTILRICKFIFIWCLYITARFIKKGNSILVIAKQ